MVRKVILGIFISFLFIFAMSHNANAIDFSLNLDNYNLSRNIDRHNITLRWNSDTTTCSAVSYCEVYDNSDISRVKYFKNDTSYSIPSNSIVIWRVLVGSQLHDGYSNGISLFGQKNFTTKNDNFIFLGYNQKTLDSNDVYTTLIVSPDNTYESNVVSTYHNFTVFEYYFKVLNGGNYYIGFETSNYNSINADLFDLNAYNNSKIMFKGLGIQVWSPTESKENKEVEEKTQEAVNESEESGGDSQSSVEGSTQSLMSAGASIMSALTSAPATDCNISVNTTGSSSVFTTAIGQLNLCSNVPSGILNMVQGIVALVFTPIVLYFTYNVITILYNQFKEYNS